MKKNLLIPCNILKKLLVQYNIGLNQLGKIFIDEIDEEGAGNLKKWISSLSNGEKERLPQILKLIATPSILVNTSIVIEVDSVIRTWAISNSVSQGFIGINDEEDMLEINVIEDMTMLINSLMIYLDMAVPVAEGNVGFKVDVDDMPLIFSLMDLHQRKKYSGMLDHTWLGEEMFLDDIQYFFKDSVINPDVRWLLPFSLGVFKVERDYEVIENSLERLEKLNILKRKESAWCFTPQGRAFADSCINRISQMSLSVIDADSEGNLQQTECILVRSNRTLWLFLKELSENTVLITSLSGEKAGVFFSGLFSAEGVPKEISIPTESVITPKVEMPKSINKNKVSSSPKFCSNCGNALKSEQRFCNVCGKKLINN